MSATDAIFECARGKGRGVATTPTYHPQGSLTAAAILIWPLFLSSEKSNASVCDPSAGARPSGELPLGNVPRETRDSIIATFGVRILEVVVVTVRQHLSPAELGIFEVYREAAHHHLEALEFPY